MSGNKLQYFKYHWFQKLISFSLSTLKLSGNNFLCDCALKEDGHWLEDQSKVEFLEFVLAEGENVSLKDVKIECHDPDKRVQNILSFKEGSRLKDFTSKHTCRKPVVKGISKDSTVKNGNSLLLKCIAEGQPTPIIEWKAPNEDVYRLQSNEFEGITVHMDGSLLIENIRRADSGEYECHARNSVGESHVKTKVQVDGRDPDDDLDNSRDDESWEEWADQALVQITFNLEF